MFTGARGCSCPEGAPPPWLTMPETPPLAYHVLRGGQGNCPIFENTFPLRKGTAPRPVR